ncbi:hypothetical protein [Citrifermentans bremense]|uniref:hypothetical protein n=1 Tax=Citrifermentans bremense TaxID=60035 RepID=UPI000403B0BA|nr:hypothetical protein [Citrifermentans bremense]
MLIAALLVNAVLAAYYRMDPLRLDLIIVDDLLNRVFAVAYREDRREMELLTRAYFRGTELRVPPVQSWKRLEQQEGVRLLEYAGAQRLPKQVTFVYQLPERPYLRALARRYALGELVRGEEEYQAMLSFCRWAGTRFDHGNNVPAGGITPVDPAEVLAGAATGKRYWCEIAAKITVEAATALGWPARLMTVSKSGYSWDHAVTELWSNHFNKWFMVDTDFNVMYRYRGVPLSCYEICRLGPRLRQEGTLETVRLAPRKPSLKEIDLLPFYRYVHIDMRNDWFTRPLRPLSPAGGDINTWWTGRDDLGPIYSSKTRVDRQEFFDWKLNQVQIFALGVTKEKGTRRLQLQLAAYSPFFDHFELVCQGRGYNCANGRIDLTVSGGVNRLEARCVDRFGNKGPLYHVSYLIK